MPLEFQTTVWALNSEGMEDVVFKKYKIINKGNISIEDMYLSYWADPDLGNAGDDYAGCDTLLSLGYCYNGDEIDENFYESPPPAVGHLIVQGPVVDGNENDSAFVSGEWVKGLSNLQPSAIIIYMNSDGFPYFDPREGVYEGTLEMYNYMRGYQTDGSPLIDPNTGIEICRSRRAGKRKRLVYGRRLAERTESLRCKIFNINRTN
ncbi:MAG: hypothetical protein GXO87_03025, partial [Chlorobi bacterium]|nr:hypothetical protein [Chlorobiota bacterium]